MELDPSLYGGDFKFHDYESVVSPGLVRRGALTERTTVDDILAAVRLADAALVAASKAALTRSLQDLLRDLREFEGSPLLAPVRLRDA